MWCTLTRYSSLLHFSPYFLSCKRDTIILDCMREGGGKSGGACQDYWLLDEKNREWMVTQKEEEKIRWMNHYASYWMKRWGRKKPESKLFGRNRQKPNGRDVTNTRREGDESSSILLDQVLHLPLYLARMQLTKKTLNRGWRGRRKFAERKREETWWFFVEKSPSASQRHTHKRQTVKRTLENYSFASQKSSTPWFEFSTSFHSQSFRTLCVLSFFSWSLWIEFSPLLLLCPRFFLSFSLFHVSKRARKTCCTIVLPSFSGRERGKRFLFFLWVDCHSSLSHLSSPTDSHCSPCPFTVCVPSLSLLVVVVVVDILFSLQLCVDVFNHFRSFALSHTVW